MMHNTENTHHLQEPHFNTPLQDYAPEVRQLVLDYTLQLADTSFILGHRLSEWCGHGPILEQDLAISNIALDLIGETRSLYQYAAELEGKGRTEDDLAYLRDAVEYKNPLLVEQPNGDFADTILRQFIFDTFHYFFLQQLQHSSDLRLAAIAAKSLKEASYHIKWSSEWVIRLGDGTEESKRRMEKAVDNLWPFSGEFFQITETEKRLLEQGIIPDYAPIKQQWDEHVTKVFDEATLTVPQNVWMQKGGKEGRHTEHLGYVLAELQYLQRAYPGLEW
ncbi:ring-1,2-phenylacetyl-CoA epoxidase subunit PaaC [Pontibacter ummariensis]|uniref:Ring-1,2-phenylacetyl-CoA epoxidase subunit PaaC n=1 Tax=Pontibacter ummariensis TaxID=1610492 RepID=A0A239KXG3_9BACT|nr:1,2-phenylacetyl-CoA epoxidase subunit PaaC [Pontibacter ummariensis]PRY04668.1 ring-1,2-phenylacetyl-CoA epoxidase subunit PaaC [Pontibacter ummariensis]SNT23067.1 ring-1,2-phenylacetyl-CoA epoxidase subunit PaaC [Pontibacter ummariensis]